MVSTNYIKELLKYMKVSQQDLADEWEKTTESDRGKKQSMISKMFKERKYVESMSLLVAVSNLTGIPVVDIWNELAFNTKDNSLIFTFQEPKEDYALIPHNQVIPVMGYESTAKTLFGISEKSGNVKSAGKISLPNSMLSEGIHVCEAIKGHRMSPTLEDGEYAIYRLMSEADWQLMIQGHIYMVLNHDGEKFLGRIKNRLEKYNLVVLRPDNKEDNFKDFVVRLEDIHQVWKLVIKIGYQFPDPNSRIMDKFEQVDDDVTMIKLEMEKLMAEVRKLKQ